MKKTYCITIALLSAVLGFALLGAMPQPGFADDMPDIEADETQEATSDDLLQAMASPYKNKFPSFEAGLKAFMADKRWAPGTPWTDDDTPKMDSDNYNGGCAAYVSDFGLFIFGTDSFDWPEYDNPSEIQAGDCIRFSTPDYDHSVAVIARNGSQLTTLEGNYGPTVERSTTRYTVHGNTFYENGRPVTFDWGNRAPDIFSYDLSAATFAPQFFMYANDLGQAYSNYEYYDLNDTYDGTIYFCGTLLTKDVDYEPHFKLAGGDEAYHRTGVLRLVGKNSFAESTAVFRFNIFDSHSWSRQAYFNENEPHGSAVRLKGAMALDTMASIVNKGGFKKNGTVVLATFDGYWDALTAAGIAGMADAPVLMTEPSKLSEQTEKLLGQLKPKTIVVCGGTSALPEKVAKAAAKAAGGATVKRCSGKTATGTAVDIFQKAPELTKGSWGKTAFVCTNDGYWDALAAAPVSFAKKLPIFLTEGKSNISQATLNAIKSGGIERVYVVGGTAAIADSVVTKLKNAGINVAGRLWGATAVETSVAVAKYGMKLGMSADGLGVATTNGYWDALSGAALCGHLGSVMVLADSPKANSIVEFAWNNSDDIDTAYVFGGTAAISSDTFQSVSDAVW
ncbi:MAG: cell wall-binding repeat-containing protein [Eggerthellaceae bacterium]|nr:cell wall-binding repeat-containing protein [Eggerthellaceae bacterium]